jgi:hypothetical protein
MILSTRQNRGWLVEDLHDRIEAAGFSFHLGNRRPLWSGPIAVTMIFAVPPPWHGSC